MAIRLTEQALAERKDTILHTAYHLFCEFGVDGVSLEQIAKEANVGTSAVYRYFETKANLLWLTQKILWEELVSKIHTDGHARLSSAKSGFEELSMLLYRFKLLYTEHSKYLLFSNDYKMYLVRNRLQLPKAVYDQLMEPVYAIFLSALQRGHADGSISRKEPVEDQLFAILGVMRGFTEQIVLCDRMCAGGNPLEGRFDLVYQYVLRALEARDAGDAPSTL